MDRLFFRDADAVVAAAAPNAFNSKMLRAAAPGQNQKQKGKSLKWNQEEETRRAIYSRNKASLTKSHSSTLLPTELIVATGCRAINQIKLCSPAFSTCHSVTEVADVSDNSAPDITSPCSANSITSPGTFEDVEVRRNCVVRDSECSPYCNDVANELASSGLFSPVLLENALASSGLFSPVLLFSRMSLGSEMLPSMLELSVDRTCAVDVDANDDKAAQNIEKYVPETPRLETERHFVTTNRCQSPRLEACAPDLKAHDTHSRRTANVEQASRTCELVRAFSVENENGAMVLETPLKNEFFFHSNKEINEVDDQVQHEDAEGAIINKWFQVQAQTLMREFPPIKLLDETFQSCIRVKTSQNKTVESLLETPSKIASKQEIGDKKTPTADTLQLRSQSHVPVVCFHKLQPALDFYARHSKQDSLHVWAEEFSPAGARKFLVATCDAFARYSFEPRFSGGRRHFYEVIPEGAPCNLYIDVEWTRKGGANSWINDDLVMTTMVERLGKFVSSVFAGVTCSNKRTLHLESSTPEKFSRHLIVNAESATENSEAPLHVLFAHNVHAGAFVTDFVTHEAALAGLTIGQTIDPQTLHRLHEENDAARLFCFNAEGTLTSCIDTGIYNKNRCFRLPLSSKCGKSAVLVPHSSNQLHLDGSDIGLLKAALVCPCGGSSITGPIRLLTHSRASKLEDARNSSARSCSWLAPSQRNLHFSSGTSSWHSGGACAKSIDESVLDDWAAKTGMSGQCCGIKASLVSGSCLVSYSLTKSNRWCERVGRQHKSNCTFLVADMCAGVYWQSCWDVDCKGFKSRAYRIPGWSVQLSDPHDHSSSDTSEQGILAHPSHTENQHVWDDQRALIDAELHEELIWMEAAVACDRYTEPNARCSDAVLNNMGCVLAVDVDERDCGSSQTKTLTPIPPCCDLDDWYTGEIEVQISALERQRNA